MISDEYVGVDLLLEALPASACKGIRLVTQLALCAFSAFVFYNCVIGPDGLLAVTPPAMVSTALELPMKNIYFALVILFGCYVISYLFRIYLMFTKKEEGRDMVALLFITFVICLALGVPVAFSLGISSLVYFIGENMSLYMFAQRFFAGLNSFTLYVYQDLFLRGA